MSRELKALLRFLDAPEYASSNHDASHHSHQQRSPSLSGDVARIHSWLQAAQPYTHSASHAATLLATATQHFALSVWAHPALAAGWSDGELFAAKGGLIPNIARDRLHILALDGVTTTVMTGRGSIEVRPRPKRCAQTPPWWLSQDGRTELVE
jgi:hypothetical protein